MGGNQLTASSQETGSILAPDFLGRLEYLSLLSKRMFRGRLLAQRRTMQVGGGIEFADHREYISGDDLRYLDWKVYARHGDRLIKRFQEEEDLHVYLFLDASPSMNRGDEAIQARNSKTVPDTFLTKWTLAKQLAATLAYIALADLDRASVIVFGDGLSQSLPPVRGKDQVLSLLKFLESVSITGERTDLASAVDSFVARSPRTGLAVVISDLYDHSGFLAGVDRLRHARFEPHVIQIHTPDEANPTTLGDVEFADCETGQTKKVTVTERKLKQYRDLFAEFVETCKRDCTSRGLPHTVATTDVPFDAVIMAMMRSAAVG